MNRTITTILGFAIALLVTADDAQAQAIQRTFVSTFGTDTGNCNVNAPCRSFTYALTQVAADGEIVALTSGGYGPVEITKAVQITAPNGVYAAITAQPATAIGGTDAIRVDAGSSDTVIIRGLTLNNLGTTNANGITFPAGQRLYVENCVINGFDFGITVERSTGGEQPELFLTDTTIRNGAASSPHAGVFVRHSASGNIVRATIENCRLERAGHAGVLGVEGAMITARNTVSSQNPRGFVAAAAAGGVSRLNLENCSTSNNGLVGIHVGDFFTPYEGGLAVARIFSTASGNNNANGVFVGANGTAHVSHSSLEGNSDGIRLADTATAAVFVTFTTISGNAAKGLNRNGVLSSATTIGNNAIFNNGAGSDPFSATIPQQ